MPGKMYYMTTLAAWQRHAHQFTGSHWIALETVAASAREGNPPVADATPILVLVEADEGAHVALEADSDITPLPHPLAQNPIPAAAQSAIAARGITIPEHATTFETAESLASLHPLLRHRVF
jgi:hypothetical protein